MLTRILRTGAMPGAAVMLVACRSGEPARDRASDSASTPAAAAPGDARSRAANVVTVTTTDYVFEAPAKIPAGLTTFQLVNRGPRCTTSSSSSWLKGRPPMISWLRPNPGGKPHFAHGMAKRATVS